MAVQNRTPSPALISPISVTATLAAFAAARNASALAAGTVQTISKSSPPVRSAVSSMAGSAATAALAASDSGTRATSIVGRHLRGPAQLGEIADKAVGHVHRRRGMGAHRLGQRIARLRQQIARRQMLALRIAEFPGRAFAQHKAERGVADRAADEHAVARLGAGAAHHAAFRHAAEHGDGNRDRPRRAVGVAAEQRAAEQLASSRRPCAKPASQSSPISFGSASDSRKPSGLAPLAARSDRLTRSALRATSRAASSAKKCTPPMMASVLSTRSQPGGGLMKAASSDRPSAPGWVAIGSK